MSNIEVELTNEGNSDNQNETPVAEGMSIQYHDVAAEIEIDNSELTHKCVQCLRTFKSRPGLKRHEHFCNSTDKRSLQINKKCGSNESYECVHCAEKFDHMSSLNDHMNTHIALKGKFIYCDYCGVKFKKKSSIINHLTTVHSNEQNALSKKPKRRKRNELKKKKNIIQCNECGQVFTRQYHLSRHVKQKGCNGAVQTLLSCAVCSKIFTRRDNLRTHLRWHIHLSNNAFTCKLCGFHAKSFNALLRHHLAVHENNKHICDTCGKKVGSRVAFIKHLAIHGEKNFSCDQCDFRCKSAEILRRHALRHVENKPFVCHMCPASFIQNHELQAHLFKHTGKSDFVCHYCKGCFPTKPTLNSHIARAHEGKPDLFCPYEDCRGHTRPFLNAICLRAHMKSHTENKPYKCPKCDKSFHLKAPLNSHLLTHTWERPRRCMYCSTGRAYIRSDLLLRHLRNKHFDEYDLLLKRVRKVLGIKANKVERPSKQEVSALVSLIDAIIDNIEEEFETSMANEMMPDNDSGGEANEDSKITKMEDPVMNEDQLAENIESMIEKLIDKEQLECLGWPNITIDDVLECVLKQCDVTPATTDKYPRVTCLRENVKQLFLRVIEDTTITRMLNTRTVDQVIRHVVSAST